MNNDPIVASVRRIREELAGKFGYDVHAIFADLRERESNLGERLLRQRQAEMPNEVMQPSTGAISKKAPSSPAAG